MKDVTRLKAIAWRIAWQIAAIAMNDAYTTILDHLWHFYAALTCTWSRVLGFSSIYQQQWHVNRPSHERKEIEWSAAVLTVSVLWTTSVVERKPLGIWINQWALSSACYSVTIKRLFHRKWNLTPVNVLLPVCRIVTWKRGHRSREEASWWKIARYDYP